MKSNNNLEKDINKISKNNVKMYIRISIGTKTYKIDVNKLYYDNFKKPNLMDYDWELDD